MTEASGKRRVAVVTGTRAEFGLLRPVMRAIEQHPSLSLQCFVTGTHMLPPACTRIEIENEFSVIASIAMQQSASGSRFDDARSLAKGIAGLADAFETHAPDVVVVLGDRIEAFAAASAAAIAGIRVAHMHGGDRAEGIADESMRHAITKLSHLHLPATETSANRIIAMGEEPARVHTVGSPAIDALASIPPLTDEAFADLGDPQILFLLHPLGESDEVEHARAARLLEACKQAGRTLALHPNHDPGRDGIVRAIEDARCPNAAHLPRDQFIGLLRRADVLVGNSSAGLIEAAAVPCWSINVGRRQHGREHASNVTHVADSDYQTMVAAIETALRGPIGSMKHPFGDGRTGSRVAELLASIDLASMTLTKRNTY